MHSLLARAAVIQLLVYSCAEPAESRQEPLYPGFGDPQRVSIRGYQGDAMEPFISRDGHFLFFNSLNDPAVNTNLHYAERVNDLTFEYRGELQGANTGALEGVPSMDSAGNFYFVSSRSYSQTLSTIYRGRFSGDTLDSVQLVLGFSTGQPGAVNFDVEESPDGATPYFVDGLFRGGSMPEPRTSRSRCGWELSSGARLGARKSCGTSTALIWSTQLPRRPMAWSCSSRACMLEHRASTAPSVAHSMTRLSHRRASERSRALSRHRGCPRTGARSTTTRRTVPGSSSTESPGRRLRSRSALPSRQGNTPGRLTVAGTAVAKGVPCRLPSSGK